MKVILFIVHHLIQLYYFLGRFGALQQLHSSKGQWHIPFGLPRGGGVVDLTFSFSGTKFLLVSCRIRHTVNGRFLVGAPGQIPL